LLTTFLLSGCCPTAAQALIEGGAARDPKMLELLQPKVEVVGKKIVEQVTFATLAVSGCADVAFWA
jgi:hypothetical protein